MEQKRTLRRLRILGTSPLIIGLIAGYLMYPGSSKPGDFYEGYCPTPRWVIAVTAVKESGDARARAQKLSDQGYSSGYLWIPDYGSLSGAKMYLVYIGPFAMGDKASAQGVLSDYQKKNKDAYGIKVAEQGPRETFGPTSSSSSHDYEEEDDAVDLPYYDGYCPTPSWVITVAAVKGEKDARARTLQLVNNGYRAGFLWIPDYGSLSGAQMYLVYIGPYNLDDKASAKSMLREYKKINSTAYGIKVSKSGKRETF